MIAQTINDAQKHWGWYMALGIALILVGFMAISSDFVATLATVIFFGWLVFIGGIFQITGAFFTRGAGNIILMLLIGLLDVVIGLVLIRNPVAGALSITLLLAILFVFGGIFRFVSALWMKFPNYGWAAFSGFITFVLGVLLWNQWPPSALWFIGFAVGINFIFAGVSWSSLAWKLKSA